MYKPGEGEGQWGIKIPWSSQKFGDPYCRYLFDSVFGAVEYADIISEEGLARNTW